MNEREVEAFDPQEFLAWVIVHIPEPQRHLVRYDGWYSNVSIYAVSSSPQEAAKKDRALDLIEGEDFSLSAQVLLEFYVIVTRKIVQPLPSDIAVELLKQFRQFPLALTDYPLIVAGVETSLRYGISKMVPGTALRNCAMLSLFAGRLIQSFGRLGPHHRVAIRSPRRSTVPPPASPPAEAAARPSSVRRRCAHRDDRGGPDWCQVSRLRRA